MRVVIIEDEEAARESLNALLQRNIEPQIEVIETIDSVVESIEFFKSPRSADVDLVFMDIHLSDGYAFSIFKHVEVSTPIIFTTAYDEYALKSFEVNCIDYILKPISGGDVERIFSKIKSILQLTDPTPSSAADTLLAIDRWRTVPLKISDIAILYKDGSKVKAYNHEGSSFYINMTLEKLEERLSGKTFTRANRQFILSRCAVRDIENYDGNRALVNLHIPSPEAIVISRTKVSAFKGWLIG